MDETLNRGAVNAIFSKLGETKTQTTLSHYTGLEGLRCILKYNKLWASNIRFLNDSKEMIYGLTEAVRFLKAQTELFKDSQSTRLFADIQKRLLTEAIPDAFACCFCERRDMLGQWRGYGGVGQNVSIEFDLWELDALVGVHNARIAKVTYGQDQARLTLHARFNQLVMSNISSGDLFKRPDDEKHEALKELILSLAPQFKHKTFEDEREWRAIIQRPSDGSNVEFRTRDNMLVPYLELGQLDKKLPVVSITVGPGKDMDLTKKSIENYLNTLPFYKDVPVKKSFVPFRT